jgi:hypothetical protein
MAMRPADISVLIIPGIVICAVFSYTVIVIERGQAEGENGDRSKGTKGSDTEKTEED